MIYSLIIIIIINFWIYEKNNFLLQSPSRKLSVRSLDKLTNGSTTTEDSSAYSADDTPGGSPMTLTNGQLYKNVQNDVCDNHLTTTNDDLFITTSSNHHLDNFGTVLQKQCISSISDESAHSPIITDALQSFSVSSDIPQNDIRITNKTNRPNSFYDNVC